MSVKVNDDDNAASNQATQQVTVNNVAPIVNVTGPATADEGQTKTYNFTVTDPGQDTWSAAAGFPDCDDPGSAGQLVAGSYSAPTQAGGSFQCFFPDGPATANVRMRVTDEDGGSGADTETVQVVAIANVPPAITAPANQSSNEGESKTFSLGSFTDPGPDANWTVDVDWGDTSSESSTRTTTGSMSGTHTYTQNGTYTVSVKVTDKDNASDTKTFTVTVSNVKPTVTASSNQSSNEGESKSFALGSFADPGPDSPWTVDVNWGDSTTPDQLTMSAPGPIPAKSHTYVDNGTYTVTVKVTDKDGGYDSKTFTVTVANLAPVIDSWAAGGGGLGGPLAFAPVTFTGNFTDAGVRDWNWLAKYIWDGVADPVAQILPQQGTWTKQHVFTTAGCSRTATVTITDKDGAVSAPRTATASVGTGEFLPPMTNQPVTDKLKNGQVLPVKVKITDCNGVPVSGLQPAIRLVKGDQTGLSDDTLVAITPESVSSADTTGYMRAADGQYIYNMRVSVPSSDLNSDYTVVIYPYGIGNVTQTLRHVIRATK